MSFSDLPPKKRNNDWALVLIAVAFLMVFVLSLALMLLYACGSNCI